MPVEKVNPGEFSQRPVAERPVERDVLTSDVVSAFNENENVIFNAANIFARPEFEKDPEFDPWENMDGYEGFADDLQHAESRREMEWIKDNIQKKQENNATIASATFPQMALGIGSFIASDPTTLIPIGGAAHKTYRTTGRILEGGAKTAAAAAAIETGREAYLQHQQPGRQAEEAFYNIGGAAVIGGMLGGAASALSKTDFDRIAEQYEKEMITPEINKSTAGAKQTGTTIQDEEIAGLKRTKKVMRRLPGFLRSPTLDGATSKSFFMRKYTEKMTDLGLIKNKNLRGIESEMSVERKLLGYDAVRVPVFKAIKESHKKYRQRAANNELTPDEFSTATNKPLTRNEFEEEIDRAVRSNAEHHIPEVREAAKVGREFYDGVMERGIKTGLFDEGLRDAVRKTSPTFSPRNWKKNKIIRERTRFKNEVLLPRLRQRQDELDEEIEDLAEDIINRITNTTDGRIPYDIEYRESGNAGPTVGARGSAKSIKLDFISDADADEWIEHNFTANMENYIRSVAPDMEIMDKFGSLDFNKIKSGIADDYKKLIRQEEKRTDIDETQRNKNIQNLQKEQTRDIKTAQGIFDKMRGTRPQTDDYSVPLAVAERLGLAWNFVTLLGDVVGSSIPDMGRTVMVHGFSRSYGNLIKNVMTDVEGIKRAGKDIVETGTALDITNSMTALKRANMDEFVPATNKTDQFSRTVSQGVANLTGINIWNAGQRTFSGIITQNRMLEAIEKMGAGKAIGNKETANLASHGISRNMARRIAKQFKKHGEKRRNVRVANARVWDDLEARDIFRNAVRKQVDEIIINPGFEKPLWMTDPGFRMIGQFKSFAFGSMQRSSMAALQQGDRHALAGLSLSIFLGMNVYAYKQIMAGREISDDPRVWVTEGVDRSGVTGWFFDANNIIEKATRGTIGVNALTGGPPMSRYAARNITDAMLGPSIGKLKSIFQATGAAFSRDVNESDIHAVRRLIPGQNIPYLRGTFDKVEEAAKENMLEQ